MDPFPAGTIVRKKRDPGKYGQTMEETRVAAGGRTLQKVRFFISGVAWIPIEELEIPPESSGPIDHIKEDKFVAIEDIRNRLIHIKMNGKMADLIYSMEATNTDYYAHQYKPVLKMLNNSSGSLFIADEVGLGKTIEAGLIWTELRARFDFDRLMVLCPNSLRRKWEAELSEKFGLDARIVDAEDLLSILTRTAGNNRSQVLISGIQNVRPRKDWHDKPDNELSKADKLMRFIDREGGGEPLFNLLIIDESHHLKNEESVQHDLGMHFRSVSDYAVFLSATPIHLKSMDLFNQLRLLAPERFENMEEFEELIRDNQFIIEAKNALLNEGITSNEIVGKLEIAAATQLLSGNRQLEILIEKAKNIGDDCKLTHNARVEMASDLEKANLLSDILTRTRRRDVDALRITRQVSDHPIEMSPLEEDLYNTVSELVAGYASKKQINQRFLLAMPQRMLSSSIPAALAHWRSKLGFFSDSEDGDDDQSLNLLHKKEERPLTALLSERTADINISEAENSDTKYASLKEILDEYRTMEEKVIVFSTFKSTLGYLQKRLTQDSHDCLIMHGGIDNRHEVIDKFRASRGSVIFLSSEIGSEGLDLQFCKVLFNYDLPWNPMRIEQRIGRIDRFGQVSKTVTIVNFLHKNTIDERIYERLYMRLNLIKNTLGEFEAVLGDEIRKLTIKLISGEYTEEEEKRVIDQAALAIEQRRAHEEELEEEAAGLIAHGDYILRQVQAANSLNRWISDTDLENYLSGFLGNFYPTSHISKSVEDASEYTISMDNDLRKDFSEYLSTRNMNSKTRLTEFGEHRFKFGKIIERSVHRNFEVLNQAHPLLRFASQKFEENDSPNVRPAAAVRVQLNDLHLKEPPDIGCYLTAVSKWTTDGAQRLEKLSYKLASVDTGDRYPDEMAELFTTELINKGLHIPNVGKTIDKGEVLETANELINEAQQDYDNFCEVRRAENDDKADVQSNTLERHHAKQVGRLNQLIDQYERNNNVGLKQVQINKLEKINLRFETRREQIIRSRNFSSEYEDVTLIYAEVA